MTSVVQMVFQTCSHLGGRWMREKWLWQVSQHHETWTTARHWGRNEERRSYRDHDYSVAQMAFQTCRHLEKCEGDRNDSGKFLNIMRLHSNEVLIMTVTTTRLDIIVVKERKMHMLELTVCGNTRNTMATAHLRISGKQASVTSERQLRNQLYHNWSWSTVTPWPSCPLAELANNCLSIILKCGGISYSSYSRSCQVC